MKKKLATVCAILSASLCLTGALPLISYAEEIQVPGYHEYETSDTEAIDRWYGIAKGYYLKEGICGIKDAGRAKVSISATTNAHTRCDSVKVGLYLDESLDGGGSFGTIGIYHFTEENATSCYGSKSNIEVTSGRKYRSRGVHSVKEGSKTETTDTCSGTLTAS